MGLGQFDGGRQLVKSGCCRVHTTAGGLVMVIALGGRAGGAVAFRATVRGGPAWWVFRAGFVGRQAGFVRVLLGEARY